MAKFKEICVPDISQLKGQLRDKIYVFVTLQLKSSFWKNCKDENAHIYVCVWVSGMVNNFHTGTSCSTFISLLVNIPDTNKNIGTLGQGRFEKYYFFWYLILIPETAFLILLSNLLAFLGCWNGMAVCPHCMKYICPSIIDSQPPSSYSKIAIEQDSNKSAANGKKHLFCFRWW